MAMHSYRFGQSQGSYDAGGDQGTWQSPFQSDAYYTGAPQNYFTDPPHNSGNNYSGQSGGGGSSGSASGLSLSLGNSGLNGGGSASGSSHGLSGLSGGSGSAMSGSAYNTGISNFKSSVGISPKNSGQQSSSFMASQMNSSMQDMMGYGSQSQDDGHSQMGYYGSTESYDNSGMQGNMMGLNSGNPMGNDNNNGSNNLNMMGYNSNNNNMNMMGMGNNSSSNIVGSGNDMMSMSSGNNMLGSNSGGNISNEMQSQIMAAAAGLGAMANWQNDYGNNQFTANFNKRGRRRGRGGMVNPLGNRFFHGQNSSGHGDLTIHLNATNYNQWGYLRKSFNKRDDDLMEHLYEIHEKFCHRCRERLEEKQTSKKRKYQDVAPGKDSDEPAPEEGNEVEEELTEEELEMKKLMGFAGFKSTKGSRVKDNSYKTVSSVNCNNEDKGESDQAAEDQTTSLTAEEKKMIASIGGFSVFTKDAAEDPKASVGFGAPAVTMQPMEGSGPGFSDAPLFDTEKEGNTK